MPKPEKSGVDQPFMPLQWVVSHAGSGHDTVREQTREEYRRLLASFALAYFPSSLRLGDVDRAALQGFIGWLTNRPGRRGSALGSLDPQRADSAASVP